MRVPLAWLNLVHEKSRLVVALAGVAFAVLLVFMNLGFLGALAQSASMFYQYMDADVFLVSPQTLEISSAKAFPRDRLYQAAGIKDVERVMPLYLGYLQWRNPQTRDSRAVFMFAYNPQDRVFSLPELNSPATLTALDRPDTVLFDRLSRPEYGSKEIGTKTEVDRRTVTIGGQYELGGGFAADATVISSDQNFLRLLKIPLNLVNMGLVKLAPGADVQAVATRLRQVLPKDVLVKTKAEIIENDRSYWITSTSTGFIFGMGVAVSCVVGVVIVYQILYTDISDHMKQYATLKAMGYRSGYLFNVVIQEAIILSVLGYIPGFLIAVGLYAFAADATNNALPVAMDWQRAVMVFILTITMCVISALISVRKVVTAEPVELF
ncbi:MAG: ABC transporter permease DevC [Timaviella obliquedivisa GSE-PSE-MK23-08B]|jgi:putative ABC transport system permease protein|nr:ABC transporter permease DevC [Timaviella obliquedivisa GSE-PSE-MK23-08B]